MTAFSCENESIQKFFHNLLLQGTLHTSEHPTPEYPNQLPSLLSSSNQPASHIP